MAEALRTDFPEFENVTKIHHPMGEPIIEINAHKRFKQDHVMLTDPDFLEIFDVKVLEGNGKNLPCPASQLTHCVSACLPKTVWKASSQPVVSCQPSSAGGAAGTFIFVGLCEKEETMQREMAAKQKMAFFIGLYFW
jgi:hypothetical protein